MYEKYEKLLKSRKVTSYQVAKDTGINASVFSDWKNGKSSPKADKLLKLANYFDVSIEYFLKKEVKA